MLIVGELLECIDRISYSPSLVPGSPTQESSNNSSIAVFPTSMSIPQANFPRLPNFLIFNHHSPDQYLLCVSSRLTYSLEHQLPRLRCRTSGSYRLIGGQTRRHKWSRVSSLNMSNSLLASEQQRGRAVTSSGLAKESFMMLRRLLYRFCQKM